MKAKDKLLAKNINNKSKSKLKNNSKQNILTIEDKKKKPNINIFQDFFNNNTAETKYHKVKIKKMNQSVKDINPQKNTSNIVNRITQSNKDYEKTENKIYKRTDYEKDHYYFSFNKYLKGKKKIRIITKKLGKYKNNILYKKDAYSPLAKTINYKNEDYNDDNDDDDEEIEYKEEKENNDDEIEENESNNEDDPHKEGDIMFRTLYSANINKKGITKKIKDRNKSVQNDNKNKEVKMQKIEDNNISNDKLNASNKNAIDNKNSNDLDDIDIVRRKRTNTIKIPKSLAHKKNDKSNPISSKYNMERTIDLYVLDGNEDIIISPKSKKEIDTNRNVFRKIVAENLKTNSKMKEKTFNKLTGFVLIRKNKGKKAYEIELEDNIEKINSIFKNKKIMINNEIVQMISLNNVLKYQNDIKSLNEKIKKLKKNINKEEYALEKEMNKDKIKDTEIENLKSKIEELNKIINNQKLELEKYVNNNNSNEAEQLKQPSQTIEKEKEKEKKEKENTTLIHQVSNSSNKKKINTQIEYNQKNIKDMKERIQKYKDELKKRPGHRQSYLSMENRNSKMNINKIKKHKNSVEIPRSKFIDFEKKKNEVNQKNDNQKAENIQKDENNQKTENIQKDESNQKIEDVQKDENVQKNENNAKNEDEDEDDDDTEYGLDFKDDRNNPKSKKMRKAVNRFNQKYSTVIKEEKKLIKLKEKEEADKQKEDNEENGEDYNNENDNNNNAQNNENLNKIQEKDKLEKEEKERQEAERLEKEKQEAERIDKLNKEKIEKEELEKKEKERIEREEAEKKEKERKLIEEERKRKEEIERKKKEEEENKKKKEEERRKKMEEEKKKKEEEEKKKKEEEEKKKKEEEEKKKKEEEEKKKKEEEEKKKKEEEEKKKKEEEEKKKKEEEEKKKKEEEEKKKKEEEEEKKKKEIKEEKLKEGKQPSLVNKFEGGTKNKMQGNFAKMLADKLKMPPGGMKKVNIDAPKRESNPRIIQNNVDVSKLIEQKPFKGRAARRKPTRKVFIEKNEEDN